MTAELSGVAAGRRPAADGRAHPVGGVGARAAGRAAAGRCRTTWRYGWDGYRGGSGHRRGGPACLARLERHRRPSASKRRAHRSADRRGVVAVDRAWRVRTASDALRDASDLLGRSYLRSARGSGTSRPLAGRRTWCRPVVLGVMAAEAGLGSAADRPAGRLRGRPDRDRRRPEAPALRSRPRGDLGGGRRGSGGGAWSSGSPAARAATTSPPTPHRRSSTGPSCTTTARGGCSVPDHVHQPTARPANSAARGGRPGRHRQELADRPAVPGARRRAQPRRDHQRHLHRRGRPLPAFGRGARPRIGSEPSRPGPARTRRSATTSARTCWPSRTSSATSHPWTWSWSSPAATT